jgi:hypothetical protein|nr:MAG TPA: hypothetical protein [Caudoviricetes sp.]
MAKSKKKKKGGSKKLKKSNLVLASPTALTNIARNEARRKLEPEIKRIEQELIQKEKEMEDLVYQGLFVRLLGIPLLTLRNRGYGKKRLEEFYNEMYEIFKDFHLERLTTNDIAEAIYDETGYDLLAQKKEFAKWLQEHRFDKERGK